jgi:hypothetical protein
MVWFDHYLKRLAKFRFLKAEARDRQQRVRDESMGDASVRERRHSAYSVEKLISCALTILPMNHSMAENQA